MTFGSNFYHHGDLETPDDAERFHAWVLEMDKNKFPLEVYVDGVSFSFDNQRQALYFCLGWELRARLDF